MKTTFTPSLSHSVEIFVPSTVAASRPAPLLHLRKVHQVSKLLCAWFGGCTSYRGRGSWVDASGRLISEAVTIVFANCTRADLDKNLNNVIEAARRLCVDMSQVCVSVRIDGRLIFVEK